MLIWLNFLMVQTGQSVNCVRGIVIREATEHFP